MSSYGYTKNGQLLCQVMGILRMVGYYAMCQLYKECSVTMSCVSNTKNVQLLFHVLVILRMLSYYVKSWVY